MRSFGRQVTLLAREIGRYPRYWARLLQRPDRLHVHGVCLEVGERVTPKIRNDLYAERYERGEARCVVARLERDDVVLEIGAGMGFISTLCARLIGSERVTSYEADPTLIPTIRRTYELNGVEPTLINAVLADQEGTASFFIEKQFVSSSTRPRSQAAREVAVPQLDVNAEIRRVRPTCLIVDIEGAESDLLPCIDLRAIRKIIIELHPRSIGHARTKELLALLAAQGFAVHRSISTTRKKYLERRR